MERFLALLGDGKTSLDRMLASSDPTRWP